MTGVVSKDGKDGDTGATVEHPKKKENLADKAKSTVD